MKKILLYSSDFIMGLSVLMYLQDKYCVTITTNINDFESILKSTSFDLIVMDIEPSREIENLCRKIHRFSTIPVVLMYVYSSRLKDFDKKIRKYVRNIFYKPFDLLEVTNTLDVLTI